MEAYDEFEEKTAQKSKRGDRNRTSDDIMPTHGAEGTRTSTQRGTALHEG